MSDTDPFDDVSLPTSRRNVLGAAAGIGAASLTAGSAFAAQDDGEETDAQAPPFTAIEFTNQSSDGTEIVVDAVTVSDGGYVAVHDGTLLEGQVAGSVIGVSEYLEPGVHYSVPITLFEVPGADFDQSSLEGTSPLIPMPHQETNDNETYDFVSSEGEADGPYAEEGLPAIDAGFVTVDGDDDAASAVEDAPFAAVEFPNQADVTDAVTIRDVTLSDGGFVTLHDARLLGGDALASVVGVSEYLEPGRHQAVEVMVDDPGAITEVELPARPLLPMPHLDTNGNEAYDFVDSEGAEDGPYTKAGQAVVDAGLVTITE